MIRIDTEPDQAIGSEPDRPNTPDRVAEQPIQVGQDDVKKSRYERPIIIYNFIFTKLWQNT